MSQATLVIMAAGMGSRFGGGIKQLAPVGPNGEIIMDYSIYDAMEAGFDKVVFVIRKDLEEEFKKVIGNRIEKQVEGLGGNLNQAFNFTINLNKADGSAESNQYAYTKYEANDKVVTTGTIGNGTGNSLLQRGG